MSDDEKHTKKVTDLSMALAGAFLILRYALYAVAVYLYATGNVNTFWAMAAAMAFYHTAEALHNVAIKHQHPHN